MPNEKSREKRSVLQALPAVLLIAVFLPLHTPGAEPVELSTGVWFARTGFLPEYATVPGPGVRLAGFPLNMLTQFAVPAGRGIREFTLWTTFRAPMNVPDPGLYWNGLGDNYELYLNGHLLRAEVFLNKGRITRHRTTLGLFVPVPAKILSLESNLLVVRLIGETPRTPLASTSVPGLFYDSGYQFGSLSEIREARSELIDYGLLAVYLFFGLYHLLLHWKRPQIRHYLFFGIASACLFLYGFARSHFLYGAVADTQYLSRLENLALVLLVPLFTAFLATFFHPTVPRLGLPERLLMGIGILLAGACLLLPYSWLSLVMLAWKWTLRPAVFLYVPFVVAAAVYRDYPDARRILGGFLLFFCTAAWDIANDAFRFVSMEPLFRYGFFGLIAFISAVMANRFADLYNEADRLNRELDLYAARMKRTNNALQRFIPNEVLTFLGRTDISDVKLGDQVQANMTVMFADIRGYTTLSEAMTPQDNFNFLNGYLERVAPVIRQHGGFVNQYYGDGIMALFPGQAAQAAACAIKMLTVVALYNQHRDERSRSEVRLSIGMHFGSVMLGILGEEGRISPGVVADAVNLAARLEDLTRLFDADILASSEFMDNMDSSDLAARRLGLARVRGKTKSVIVYEILSGTKYGQVRQKTGAQFEAAVAECSNGDWETAASLFREIVRKDPSDAAAAVYLERLFPRTPWEAAEQKHTLLF